MPMAEGIRVQRQNQFTIITIQRPERRNALDAASIVKLSQALDEFQTDQTQRVAILTGAGNQAFCAGADLKEIVEHGPRKLPPSGFGGLTGRYDLDKPIIAAVNGDAVGGGFEIALACDLIVAAEHARFGLPEPLVGTAALAGGLQRLPRQIGLKRAMQMILTAQLVSAAKGCEFGFVNEVVPSGEALAVALTWSSLIARCSPLAIRASKQCIAAGQDLPLREAIASQRHLPIVQQLLHSPDRIEGARSFSEQRAARWTEF